MNYDRLKQSAFPHARAVATALLLVVSLTTLTAAGTATGPKERRYIASFAIASEGERHIVEGKVVERATDIAVAVPRIETRANEWATAVSGTSSPNREVRVRARIEAAEQGVVEVEIYENGALVETANLRVTPKPPNPAEQFSGEPISIEVTQADLRDVLRMFGDLTSMKVEIAPEVEGVVTMKVKNMPWDQALDTIARQHGLTIRIANKTLHVSK